MAAAASIAVLLALLHYGSAQYTQFPESFLFGVATASHQIEGAWNEGGKSENVWDRLTHTRPEMVADLTNGDIACDSYHRYKEDVSELAYLGVDFYRFSLSWARILPTGRIDQINPEGIKYYNDLLDELAKENIKPLVTLFHWDLPQTLQDLGGWANPALIDYFRDYSEVCFREFGDKIKSWITFNEPYEICEDAYGDEKKAPAVDSHGVGNYLCSDNLLKAHAVSYHLYNDTFRPTQNGEIMISINSIWYEPSDWGNIEQVALAETANQFKDLNCNMSTPRPVEVHPIISCNTHFEFVKMIKSSLFMQLQSGKASLRGRQDVIDFISRRRFGWFAHPIFTEAGGYPEAMITNVAKHSEAEGLLRPRLQQFDAEWIEKIKGTSDFLGINHYTTHLITGAGVDPTAKTPSWLKDIGAVTTMNVGGESASEWLRDTRLKVDDHFSVLGVDLTRELNFCLYIKDNDKFASKKLVVLNKARKYSSPDQILLLYKWQVVPTGFGNLLRWCKHEYNNIPIYITENGFSDRGTLEDYGRIQYYNDYLTEILKAINDDGVKILGYTAWTLMDNFEWRAGFSERFGFYSVDITDPARPRTPKLSADYYKTLIANRQLPQEERFKAPAMRRGAHL